MPELPEVETVRRQLTDPLVGRRIVEVDAHPSAKFAPALDTDGAAITRLDRRGKYLLVGLADDRELVVHLGMTGRLGVIGDPAGVRSAADDDLVVGAHHPHRRAWWRLDDGRALVFDDVRRFGRLRVVPTGDYRSIPTLRDAGPEPWDPALDARSFHAALRRSRRPIKTQLLSQRPIAGVGNIYADEALWAAGIHPKRRSLGRERAGDLLGALRSALDGGIRHGGTTLRDYRDARGERGDNQTRLRAYGRAGLPCERCGTALTSDVIDARTTTWCPRCQT